MFSKETYIRRRAELKRLVKSGIIILFGNNDSPAKIGRASCRERV